MKNTEKVSWKIAFLFDYKVAAMNAKVENSKHNRIQIDAFTAVSSFAQLKVGLSFCYNLVVKCPVN